MDYTSMPKLTIYLKIILNLTWKLFMNSYFVHRLVLYAKFGLLLIKKDTKIEWQNLRFIVTGSQTTEIPVSN